jgi:hypothetical protein
MGEVREGETVTLCHHVVVNKGQFFYYYSSPDEWMDGRKDRESKQAGKRT